jgi:hypothetical protein
LVVDWHCRCTPVPCDLSLYPSFGLRISDHRRVGE